MRYLSGHVYSLVLHPDAKADLTRIRQVDEDCAADIEVFLEEAKNNQETLDNLTRKGYVDHGDVPFDIDDWGEARRLKYNLWRIKFLFVRGPASKYRVIYAFHTIEYRYYVLGIVERDFDYNIHHERSKQILAAYDALDIPRR